MLDEIHQLATGRAAASQDARIRAPEPNLSNDTWLVPMLCIELFRGRTMAFAQEPRAEVRAETVAEVERVAKPYLRPSRAVMVDAGHLEGHVGVDRKRRHAGAPPWGSAPGRYATLPGMDGDDGLHGDTVVTRDPASLRRSRSYRSTLMARTRSPAAEATQGCYPAASSEGV
jgi:hypothetical protein